MVVIFISNDQLVKSWERSKTYGVEHEIIKNAVLEEYKLKQYKARNEELFNVIYQTIEHLSSWFTSLNTMIFISDADGFVLKKIAGPKFTEAIDNLYLREGSNCSEQIRGTNSAGTVSVLKQTISIVGNQHYLESHKDYYCIGSPIFDLNGELIAVLNITGHVKDYQPALLAMVDSITCNIENRLLINQPIEQTVVSLYPEQEKGIEALLSIDKHGKIIGVNRKASHLFNVNSTTIADLQFDELFSNTDSFWNSNNNSKSILLNTKGKKKSSLCASILFDSHPRQIAVPNQNWKRKETTKQNQNSNLYTFNDIYYEDDVYEATIEKAKRAADTDYTIVVTGESGTGKEMVSQAIHNASTRATKPFIALNCGGIPETLMESELFGYEAGSFTGAKNTGQAGVFEQADEGTLFLDEIAELPQATQITLLRVLEDFNVTRIGGTKPIQVNVRIITATNTDLWEKVQEGTFRADLFFRLQGIQIKLPSFKERNDKLKFATRLLKKVQQELAREDLNFSLCAKEVIENYIWSGNIRQVKSAIREAVFSSASNMIEAKYFPSYILSGMKQIDSTGSLLKDMENKLLLETINKTDGNISEAARVLGIGRNTLHRKLNDLKKII